MDTDDYSQPLEKVMRDERRRRTLPLKAEDHMQLFEEWARNNPDAMHEIELAALAIDARGMRVSAKYLIERQRYEGHAKLNPVKFFDDSGKPHTYGICNTITPALGRWLLKRHPHMKVVTMHSLFDELEDCDEEI